MKLPIVAFLLCFHVFAFQAKITHFEGHVTVNGQVLTQGITLNEGDLLKVQEPLDGIGSKFASIVFANGNRLILTEGEISFNKLEKEFTELNSQQANVIAVIETYDYKMSTKSLKFNTRHGSFILHGGKSILTDTGSSAIAKNLYGKLKAVSAWGSSYVYSDQEVELHLKRFRQPASMDVNNRHKVMMEFRKIGLGAK
ncbi:MAG: hypothetical protein KC478_08595 [Bacteriovoracaceae bacterium]|nr:hypothetical protein [Bacteriovoracaceae bacterium]